MSGLGIPVPGGGGVGPGGGSGGGGGSCSAGGGFSPSPVGKLVAGAQCMSCCGSGNGAGGPGGGPGGGPIPPIYKALAGGAAGAGPGGGGSGGTGSGPGVQNACRVGKWTGSAEKSDPIHNVFFVNGSSPIVVQYEISFGELPADAYIIGAEADYGCPAPSQIEDDGGAADYPSQIVYWSEGGVAKLRAAQPSGSITIRASCAFTSPPPTAFFELQTFVIKYLDPHHSYT